MRWAAITYDMLESRSDDADESCPDWYPDFMVQALREADP